MEHRLSTTLSTAAQAAYAQVLEVVRQQDLARSIESLSGSFNKKVVKGAEYWYYQFTQPGGGLRQVFVGRDSEKIRRLVAESARRDRRATDEIGMLAKSALALGCAGTTPAHYRIARRLNEVGFFRAGGVLVGTHAFLAYGNALGVAWAELARTQDIDFAHAGGRVDVALPANLQIDTKGALESLEAGFLPVPAFSPKARTASFVSSSDKTLRVDFLTPMIGGKTRVFTHEALRINLQPLRFLEFVLEDIDQAAIISNVGAVLVNIPEPVRFALHKLLIYAERRTRTPEKARKDLRQAAALLEVLAGERSDEIRRLWGDVLSRGPGWRRRAHSACIALKEELPRIPVVEAMRRQSAR